MIRKILNIFKRQSKDSYDPRPVGFIDIEWEYQVELEAERRQEAWDNEYYERRDYR